MTLADATPATSPPQAFQHYPVQALMSVTQRPAAVFTHGRGSWLWDSEGRRYLDLVQGWAVNTLGHAPPAIAQALATQSQRLLQPGSNSPNGSPDSVASNVVISPAAAPRPMRAPSSWRASSGPCTAAARTRS